MKKGGGREESKGRGKPVLASAKFWSCRTVTACLPVASPFPSLPLTRFAFPLITFPSRPPLPPYYLSLSPVRILVLALFYLSLVLLLTRSYVFSDEVMH